MSIGDIIVLALIVCAVVLAVRSRRKKGRSCCDGGSGCAGCSGCSSGACEKCGTKTEQ